MPDYNTFCLECHVNAISSLNLGRSLKDIDWTSSGGDTFDAGDKHGENIRTGDVDTKIPYNNDSDLVLACLDCHEPHGSPNATLIRRGINGEEVGAPIGIVDGDRGYQCRQCHTDDQEMNVSPYEENGWKGTHHGGGRVVDNPYNTSQSATYTIPAISPTSPMARQL